MSLELLILLVVGGIMLVAGLMLAIVYFPSSHAASSVGSAPSTSLRRLVEVQRAQEASREEGTTLKKRQLAKAKITLAAAAETALSRKKVRASAVGLEKRLRYGGWKVTPLQFRAIQLFACIAATLLAYFFLEIPLILLSFFLTPLIIDDVLQYYINRKFRAFDKDYPALLMSYVSLLKTGMSVLTGLEASAKGLDEQSLVRLEVELLLERLRLGLSEEQALNAFGETIFHPEIELFVQSVMLGRKVGGTLSTTLERLARQVRKRQQFRDKARAAIGMEKMSMFAVAGIMFMLLLFVSFTTPELIIPAFSHPIGKKIMQGAIAVIILGFYWGRKVTNIKV